MQQIPATRKHEDSAYGASGFWYYHWPDLKCVFRTDYAPGLKFNPTDKTEELTLEEYVTLYLQYEADRRAIPQAPKKADHYYYANAWGEVWKQDAPVEPGLWGSVPLYPAEYITLSLQWGQNEEDTLL